MQSGGKTEDSKENDSGTCIGTPQKKSKWQIN